jgi:hypothetical protein
MSDSTPSTDTVTIPLTQGYSTFVSPEDSDLLNFDWSYRNGYAARGLIFIHRVILERILNRSLDKGELVDHRDQNPLNNTRTNLRLASATQNQQNRKANRNNKSGYKGVSFYKTRGLWRASISINGKPKTLGYFDTPELAAEAYNVEALKHFGEFAKLNVIGEPADYVERMVIIVTPKIKREPKPQRVKREPRAKEKPILTKIKNQRSYMGVRWDYPSQKWVAEIRAQGRTINLGSFDDEKEAARAYNEASLKYFGDWTPLNYIED